MNISQINPTPPTGGPWYATVLNSLGDAVIAADMDGRVTYLNPAAAKLTGWALEDAIGQNIATVYDVVDEETGIELTRLLAKIADGGDVVKVTVDMLLVAKGGTRTPINDTATPLRDAHQLVVGVVVAFSDTSKEREAKREIKTLNERLRVALAETNHRVKNNLQIVAALVEMQAESETEPIPSAAAQRLGMHIKALAQIHGLLTDSASKSEIDRVSAWDTLAKLIPMLQATVVPRLVQFAGTDMQISPMLSTALALITNELVSNAFKHSQGNVNVELSAADGSAFLRVTDEGAGFPPDFDSLEAAHIGLALVDTLAKHDMRGSVRYENAPQGGGCVIVSFPLPQSPPHREDP